MRNEGFLIWSALFSTALVAFRRLFTSVILIALGMMIFYGIHFLDFSQLGVRFLTYWGIIFLLTAWLFLCPIFDISEIRRVYRSWMKNLRDQTIEHLPNGRESQPSPWEEVERPQK